MSQIQKLKFILEKFGFEAPLLKTQFAGEELFITDYSDKGQAPADIDECYSCWYC